MDQTPIDAYLFNEMPEHEREKFEESFLGNEALFYEIAERENELVDRYAKNELRGAELERFERSLATLPARRQKIANARVMRRFIDSEKSENKTITIAERTGFFAGLAELFSFRSLAFQFASAGLIAILAIASLFLFWENRRLGSLQQDLAESRRREIELKTQIESERDATADLTADLTAERERIEKLEADIARLGPTSAPNRPSTNGSAPTIATFILSTSFRGTGPAPVRRLELPPGVTRVSVVMSLPSETPASDRVSVRLNGETAADNLRVREKTGGEKTVSLTIPVSRIKDGRNELTVIDAKGASLSVYLFSVGRQP